MRSGYECSALIVSPRGVASTTNTEQFESQVVTAPVLATAGTQLAGSAA